MSLNYISKTYHVPARLGVRVEYTGGEAPARGEIIGSRGSHLIVRMDGEKLPRYFHPTWEMIYLDEDRKEEL